MAKAHVTEINFHTLATEALTCAGAWRRYAKQNVLDPAQATRAYKIAQLFTEQAELLSAMHRNRTECTQPLGRIKPGPRP